MNRKVIIGVSVGVAAAAAVAIIVGVTLEVVLKKPKPKPKGFRETFMARCEEFLKGNKVFCNQILAVFEQAYVGKPSCNVPVSAYDPLMAKVPFTHPCNKTMFWSKTKDVVHNYTSRNKDCFTLEDTLLGYILDGQDAWCGEEGSKETFTKGCPQNCENNPLRSFWTRVSAAFADHACGEVTVMLDGSLETPFDPSSTFAKTEIPRLRAPKVTRLNVILVAGQESNCSSLNLNVDLKKALDRNISYICKEVQKSQIVDCPPGLKMGCAACLLKTLD